ncbi:hypothetical protein Tcan_17106 [Toxocara canis]|uniref:Uncharacterized protein n=1 Tax=Toxocara canis TaxID=6265 RepID=A0A0B2V9Z2_TOXCA|nr:hypothetical protein Tcan_17106 [Toxocara canis]
MQSTTAFSRAANWLCCGVRRHSEEGERRSRRSAGDGGFNSAVSGGGSPQAVAGTCQQHGRKISPIGGTQPAEHLIMRQKFEAAVPTGNGVPCAKVVYRLASFDSSSDLAKMKEKVVEDIREKESNNVASE